MLTWALYTTLSAAFAAIGVGRLSGLRLDNAGGLTTAVTLEREALAAKQS